MIVNRRRTASPRSGTPAPTRFSVGRKRMIMKTATIATMSVATLMMEPSSPAGPHWLATSSAQKAITIPLYTGDVSTRPKKRPRRLRRRWRQRRRRPAVAARPRACRRRRAELVGPSRRAASPRRRRALRRAVEAHQRRHEARGPRADPAHRRLRAGLGYHGRRQLRFGTDGGAPGTTGDELPGVAPRRGCRPSLGGDE